ncbi:polysaccharide deacetylase family protein, partial [Bacillus cereus]|nr:polysaccharide deacetylase family protein [Bacillus cereus]
SYAYMPYNSFYYGDYINSLPYAYIPQNYEVQMKAYDRGSWTPFSWVE